MTEATQLFFIALLPPPEVQEIATKIKTYFAEVYNSRAALKSPPHITLQPPFKWSLEQLPNLQQHLQQFAQNHGAIPMVLDGFSAFKPRVIYINVLKTPELLYTQKKLLNYLENSLNLVDKISKNRPYSPHLTVAFRDLTKQNFYKAWTEFAHQTLYFEFTVNQLTLLNHNGRNWKIYQEFLLQNQDVAISQPLEQ